MNLNDAVIVITGASSGIGAATARAFAEAGASVVLAARSEENLKKTERSLTPGTDALVVPTDIREEAQIKKLIDVTIERFGRIDVLVNNAGIGVFGEITELTAKEFDSVISVNLRGTFLCMKYTLPHMYQRRSGTVVTVSSVAGRHGFAGGAAYCASKFGLMGLTESIFQEARSHNVRLMTLTPGSVDTPFFDEAQMTPPNRDRILRSEDVAATIIYAVSLPEYALIRELDIRPTNPKG